MFWLTVSILLIILYLVFKKLEFSYMLKHPYEYADKIFYGRFKRHLDYQNPVDFNEKINWLKFYSNTSRWAELADKYKVRDYVQSKGLGQTLNELYAVYDSGQDIDLARLPEAFVLKANNGSGDILAVPDKTKITSAKIRRHFRGRPQFGVTTAEPHYLKIQPKILAEKLLREDSGRSISLIDYKFFCFNGEPRYIYVCWDRDMRKVDHLRETYDIHWRPVPQAYPDSGPYKAKSCELPPPQSLAEMLRMCRILAADFPFVRVDWYEVAGRPVFGELTFTPAAGFIDYYTPEFLLELGKQLQLPDI